MNAIKTMHWCDLLIKRADVAAMNAEDLNAVCRATDDRLSTLAHGVSGIGNLLACAALNEESGLSTDAVASVGWMLESIGALIANISDVSSHAEEAASKAGGK